MAISIIDNKKIEMTPDERKMYEDICASYDSPPSQKGKDLFVDLFESDDDGIIIYLKPPHGRMTSFEVYLFLMSVMVHQHLRLAHKEAAASCEKYNKKIQELEDRISKIERK